MASGLLIKTIKVGNIGPFDNLDLKIDGKSLSFVGDNGSGKTLLLSSIVDFIYEHLRAIGFEDTLPSVGTGYRYFRKTSSNYLREVNKPGYIWIEGEMAGISLYYYEGYGINSVTDASKIIGVDEKVIPWPSDGMAKSINSLPSSDRQKLKTVAWNSAIFFLPATRFENESWKTDYFFRIDPSLDNPTSNKLGHSIEMHHSMEDNSVWLINEVFDALAYKMQLNMRNNSKEINNGPGYLSGMRVALLADILADLLCSIKPVEFYFGYNRSDRLSVLGPDGRVILKSLSYLSLGQMSILNLVMNILRLGNQNIPPQSISGLVVIDEIDTHLTGEFKSEVLPKVINMFPYVQFITTSHDPISVVGLERNAASEIIQLPSGYKIIAKDFSELEKVRNSLKTLNNELLAVVNCIKSSSKPILLVEDEHTEIYKVAWLKLHSIPTTSETIDDDFALNAPFEIISANGFNNLYCFLNIPEIPAEIMNRKIIGLFDFDEAFNRFKGLSSHNWGEIDGSDRSGYVRRHRLHSGLTAMILPIPTYRSNIASYEYGGNSLLSIELYFTNKVLGQNHYGIDSHKPGRLKKFLGNKATFWKTCLEYESNDFRAFKKLFNLIDCNMKDG